MIKEFLTLVTLLSSINNNQLKLEEIIPEFNNCSAITYSLKTSDSINVKLNKFFDSNNNYVGSYLLKNNTVDFIHIGTVDPYVDVKNGYYYNDFDDISSTINTNVSNSLDYEYEDYISLASSYSGTLPSVPSSVYKSSKSAYHNEYHLEPAPDYYQNFESTSPYYGIACGPVAAAMLTGFYDINRSAYSNLYPNYTMPVNYEDDSEKVQTIIEDFCVRFKVAENNTTKSSLMVSGLNDFFEERNYNLNAVHSTSNAFQKLCDITSNYNPCIVHTENHWSLGIGYYNVRDYGTFGLVHVGWESNRGNYMFNQNKIDGVIYLTED